MSVKTFEELSLRSDPLSVPSIVGDREGTPGARFQRRRRHHCGGESYLSVVLGTVQCAVLLARDPEQPR